MKSLIVDDEKPNRDGLRILLQTHCPEVTSIADARSAKEARAHIEANKVDILFLDINMPNENGFELLSSVADQDFSVVFVTAYSEYAVRAFKANAVDYLLKPVDTDDMKKAVQKCMSRMESQVMKREVYRQSLSNLSLSLRQPGFPVRLTLPHLHGFRIVETSSIMHLEADGNYTTLHLTRGENLLVTRMLGDFEAILDPDVFFRAHKSVILNLHFVKEFASSDGYFAVMQNGDQVMISRRRLEDFMQAIDRQSKRV